MVILPALQMGLVTGQLTDTFLRGKRLMVRERSTATYRIGHAFLAKVAVLLPLRLACVTLFGTVVYYLAGLRTDSFTFFLVFMGFMYLLLGCMLGLGTAMAAYGRALAEVVLLQIFIGIGFWIFSGIPVSPRQMTPVLSWLRFLSPFYYAVQGLAQNECRGLVFGRVPGAAYLAAYAADEISVMWAAGALMITAAAYLALGLLGICLTTRPGFRVI